ncbi:MAG TPA: hypothetical protein VHT96_08170 [Clostridia bacterium]|nr:hypothetical protein [Clostridia bacterium]
MYKFKLAAINLIFSSLAGALMQFVWVLLSGETDQLTPYGVFNMMSMGAIVGTICLFALFHVTLKNTGSMAKAIVTNDVLTLLLCFGIYLQTGLFYDNWSLDAKWIVIVVIALGASSILTVFWYKKIKYYSDKLERKKATLKGK